MMNSTKIINDYHITLHLVIFSHFEYAIEDGKLKIEIVKFKTEPYLTAAIALHIERFLLKLLSSFIKSAQKTSSLRPWLRPQIYERKIKYFASWFKPSHDTKMHSHWARQPVWVMCLQMTVLIGQIISSHNI